MARKSESPSGAKVPWSPDSWRQRPAAQQPEYPDGGAVDRALDAIRGYPPLVSAGEVERLREQLGEAVEGQRFMLQGGACAETLGDCRPHLITSQLKVLLQMSLVLTYGMDRPVIRVGRMAGQYAKPRSSMKERIGQQEMDSYRGDLVNAASADPAQRVPDPARLVRGYEHSALTLNFVRALIDGGFADLHHPENWDLSHFHDETLRRNYQRVVDGIGRSVRFVDRMGVVSDELLTKVEFYVSHEGLHLPYEECQTQAVPRRDGHYNLGAHMLWIGDRTRALDGAHIEYFRGIRNPIGVKLGPSCKPDDAARLAEVLNADRIPGRLSFITRHGVEHVGQCLPGLLRAVRETGVPVAWVVDPMHGNVIRTRGGGKTRSFDAIIGELDQAIGIHEGEGTILGGVHLELTGEDVTECIGGSAALTEEDLHRNYDSVCDPRLNYSQSLELAFLVADRLGRSRSSGNGDAT